MKIWTLFYCGLAEHLEADCLKRLQDRKMKKKKQEQVVSLRNVATNFVNSDSCCCLFCLKTGNEIAGFYRCAVSARVALIVRKTAKENILIKVTPKYVKILLN